MKPSLKFHSHWIFEAEGTPTESCLARERFEVAFPLPQKCPPNTFFRGQLFRTERGGGNVKKVPTNSNGSFNRLSLSFLENMDKIKARGNRAESYDLSALKINMNEALQLKLSFKSANEKD
jgi:hypothetical protein